MLEHPGSKQAKARPELSNPAPVSRVMESDLPGSGYKAAVCRTETARYRQLETNIYGKRCDNQRFEVSLSVLSSF